MEEAFSQNRKTRLGSFFGICYRRWNEPERAEVGRRHSRSGGQSNEGLSDRQNCLRERRKNARETAKWVVDGLDSAGKAKDAD